MVMIKGSMDLEEQVIKQHLCASCGACLGRCGYFGTYKGRVVMLDSCNLAEGGCYANCPRTPTDTAKLRSQFFDAADYVPEIGPFRGLYMTRAVDERIRAKAQHGGTTTALVKLALEEGFIDAAVLTRSEGGLNPQGMLATRPEDVEQCAGSSFQMVPTLSVLNQALKENTYKKIGIVGTPCKTLAVYKMKSNYIEKKDENADRIGLVIGLFCGWGLDWKGLENTIGKRTSPENVKLIDIPPSKYELMEVETKEGMIEVPLGEVYPIVNESCSYCADFSAEFSDLSVGGARSAKGWDYDRGWNQIIVRTKRGEELLKIAREKNVLEFQEVEPLNLEKLKKASSNKRSTAHRNLAEKSGSDKDLLYLNSDV